MGVIFSRGQEKWVLGEPIAIKINSLAKSICIWKEAPGKPMEQRITGGLQTEVGRCLGLSGQPPQAVTPIRTSKPQEAEQQQSQLQGSMWALGGQESRMWDAKHVSSLRGSPWTWALPASLLSHSRILGKVAEPERCFAALQWCIREWQSHLCLPPVMPTEISYRKRKGNDPWTWFLGQELLD